MSPVLPDRRSAAARRARTLAAGSAALAAIAAMSACGSPAANPGGTSPTPTPSSSSSEPGSDCTSESILSALPGGATMRKFDCAKVGDTAWAAAEVDPGKTVYFLQWNDGTWNVTDSDSVCGGASAGLPPAIMAYCPSPSATPS